MTRPDERYASQAELDRAAALVRRGISAAEDEEHVDAETLVLLVDGKLQPAEREVAESHLDDCAICAGELEDLRRFALERPRQRRTQPRRLARFMVPLAAAAVLAVVFRLMDREPARPAIPVPVRPSVTTTTPPRPERPAAVAGYANPKWTALVAEVRRSGKLPASRDYGLAAAEDIRRGNDPVHAAERVSPTGRVIDETRPELSWPARPGSTYEVAIFRGDEEIARSPVLHEPRWKPAQTLPRGATYIWQVETTKDGTTEIIPSPPAPQAMFAILGEAEHADLVAARRAHPRDRLLHAVLFARYGMADEARASLRDAAAAGDAAVARILAGE